MDKFKEMWERQKSFQYNFFDPDNVTEEEKIVLSKEYILSMHRELGEVLNIMPWKKHRANEKEYNVDDLREELIDCFKFLLNVCIVHGLNPESFEELFFRKSDIVEKRYEVEMSGSKQLALEFPEEKHE